MPEEPSLFETHAHTPLCGHAFGEPGEYAAAAAARGLKGIVFTCHNPMPGGYAKASRMKAEEFGRYQESIARTRLEHAGSVDVRLGLECDYVPGLESWLRDQIASAPLEYVLGSVHAQYPEYLAQHWRDDVAAFYRGYFEHLTLAAQSGLFDCLAHPDLVKIVAPDHWDVQACMPWIRRCFDAVAETGVAIELNTSGRNKAPFEVYPGMAILREACVRGIPVVIGADAHRPERVGDAFEQALDLLEAAGYRSVSAFLERQRVDMAITAARAGYRSQAATPDEAASRSPLVEGSSNGS
jgi:histidinol-phosphatase (PHP family)